MDAPQPNATVNHPASLSNNQFFKWFLWVNLGIVLSSVWFLGPFSLLFPFLGMGGSLFALLLSRWLAIKAHRIAIINPDAPRSEDEQRLQMTVAEVASLAGLPAVPAVGIYDSPDMNAFATGASHNNSLVAFSSAILEKLTPEQIRAVAAHEVAHIANRDMLAMVVLQGLINSIVLAVTFPLNALRVFNMFSDQASWLVEMLLWAVKTFAAFILTFVGGLVVKAFSRRREYRADALAARLVGPEPMAAALEAISNDDVELPREQAAYAAFKIRGDWSLSELFSTHPPVQKRIAALRQSDNTPIEQ